MKAVATLVAAGERAVADAAVHTLWLLVRDAKASLRPGGLLGMPGVQLVASLLDIVQHGQQVIGLGRTDPTDIACNLLLWLLKHNIPPTGCHGTFPCQSFVLLPAMLSLRARPRVSNVRVQEEEAVANGKTADTEVDNDDDAILLLKALAGQDSEVRLLWQPASVGQENFLLQHLSLIVYMLQVICHSVFQVPVCTKALSCHV